MWGILEVIEEEGSREEGGRKESPSVNRMVMPILDFGGREPPESL